MKSIDGGKTFTGMRGSHPDHHAMWINPDNSDIMINGNDGGGSVTVNGGKTWTTIMNQPTGQFYRVITDNQYPYRLYAGQQDNTSIAIDSRVADRSIGQSTGTNYVPVSLQRLPLILIIRDSFTALTLPLIFRSGIVK